MMQYILAAFMFFSLSLRYTPKGIELHTDKNTIRVKFHGEDVPNPVLLNDGRLVLFYPATYRIEVYDLFGSPVLLRQLVKGVFELESYSAFDADERKISVAYYYRGKTHLWTIYYDGRSEEKMFDNLIPAGLWLRHGKIIARFYEVKDDRVSRDFLIMDGRIIERRGVVAVDYMGNTPIFATKRAVYIGKRRVPVRFPVLDMRVKGKNIYLLLGDGSVGILDRGLQIVGKVERPYPRFLKVRDSLIVINERGVSHEF